MAAVRTFGSQCLERIVVSRSGLSGLGLQALGRQQPLLGVSKGAVAISLMNVPFFSESGSDQQ